MIKSSILIIDDEPNYLNCLSLSLEDDFQVQIASSGVDALNIINRDNSLALILLDLQMPEMNGVKLLQLIREKDKEIPVFILTGKSRHDWAMKCADLNVQGYMNKLVDIEELIKKMKKLLGIEDFPILRAFWRSDYEKRINSLSPLVMGALRYAEENYGKEIARGEIAAHLKVSPGHLSRQFNREIGIHLVDYMNNIKVEKCKEFLKDISLTTADICANVGITDANYLYRLFKKQTGTTIQEFRIKEVFKRY